MLKPCLLELLSHGTIFFSHNKIASAGLSAAKTIRRTSSEVIPYFYKITSSAHFAIA
jgi:hypothetical protein